MRLDSKTVGVRKAESLITATLAEKGSGWWNLKNIEDALNKAKKGGKNTADKGRFA